jgi:hypothetical protein
MSTRPILAAVLLAACGLREIDHRGSGQVTGGADARSADDPAPAGLPDAAAMDDPIDPIDPPPPSTDAGLRPDRTAVVTPDAGGATSGGPGVTIDGHFVPRARAIVFLHLGHSNMAGRATKPAALMSFFYDVDPHLWTYAKGGTFRAAKEPTAPDNEAGQAAGPGMAILRTAQAMAGPDAYVISVGHGHSGSFGGYCSAFRKGGLLYDLVMTPARELKGKVTFAAILTMLGQSEHNAPVAEQSMFTKCLAGIASEMRADLGEPELPFLVGDYEQGISRADIAPDSAFGKKIIPQIAMVPALVPRSAVIPTVGCEMQDDHHFDMAGHKQWAATALQLLQEHGWATWAQP